MDITTATYDQLKTAREDINTRIRELERAAAMNGQSVAEFVESAVRLALADSRLIEAPGLKAKGK